MSRTFDRLSLGDAQKTAWVFGAGASACAPYNVPTQASVLRRFATMTRPGPQAVQQSLNDLRDRVRAHCKRVLPGLAMEADAVTLEEVFSAYELAHDDPRSTPEEVEHAVGAFDDLLQALRLATYVFGRGDSNKWAPHARDRTPSPYAELVEHLLPGAAADPRKHTFVTFNYDVNLDRCLINLRGTVADFDVDYGVTLANARCPDAPSFEPPRHDRSVLLLRTHGALNWIRCRACRSLFTTLGRQQDIPEDLRCYACGKRRMDYVLVHPSYYRRYDDPVLQLVWGRSYEELTKADRWVFIGYSLPPADVHFRELLRDSLRVRNAAGLETEIAVVGRASAEHLKLVATYEALFEANLAVWNPTADGFADFVKRLDP